MLTPLALTMFPTQALTIFHCFLLHLEHCSLFPSICSASAVAASVSKTTSASILSEVVVAVVVIVVGKKYVHQFALLTRAGYFFGKEGCPSLFAPLSCVVLIPTYVGDQDFSPPTHFLWRQIVVSGWRKFSEFGAK
jgi:hypothetical protein